jgi:hypothetical protein
MNDEFPRPYAEEPPAVEPLSGFRLLRARPWAVLATLALTVGLTWAWAWAWMNLVPAYGPIELYPSTGLISRLTREVLLPLVGSLAIVVPLVVIAALARRRVTVGRVLGLWAASTLLAVGESKLVEGVIYALQLRADGGWTEYLFDGIAIVGMVLLGVLARWVLPLPGHPVIRSNAEVLALLVGSVLVTVIELPRSIEWNVWTASVLSGFLIVLWSVAALVTSRPKASEWSGDPVELQRQDP